MAEGVLRFLLDQTFPNPKLPVEELQTNVEYVHLSSHAPELSRASTPDWMVYLVAEAGGFNGVVTNDYRQVAQAEELIALTRLHLSVVTWREAMNDPVTAWALIVAYMPEIVKALANHGPSIFLLPVPRLIPEGNIVKALDRARDLSSNEWGTSYPEQTTASMEIMRSTLKQRRRQDLAELLDRREIRARRPKPSPGPAPPKKREEKKGGGDPLFPQPASTRKRDRR
ncbi:MAG: hypothetical protein M3323_01050 [Actinomycetota bacterium]|nr:hypothetical protein [Actinomycetota bacterium]